MESPAKAILILPDASPPAAAAARHGVAASGSIRLTRQAAASANAAPSARRGRSPMPIPDPAADRNTIGQPLLRRAAHIHLAAVASAPGRHQRDQFGSETRSRWSSDLLFKR